MNNCYQDILTGIIFVGGMISFLTGEFILSSTLFASAAIASSINVNRKGNDAGQTSCE